ncbi:endonuclease/exonuclease/phosphatase family protein [Parafilimonas sp.]|uniref:endonuclease/exonuclease/phosphatase family protein n=1 Tax=Parafilimonas sp. TaxID=1969739 RepID=UPI0039E4A0EE
MQQTRLKLILISAFIFITASSGRNIPVYNAGSNNVKVITYNVHHCNPPEKAGVIDVNAIAAVIKKQNADIAAVQEIDVNTVRSGKINEAEQLATKAGYKSSFFAKAMDYDGGQYGILILSKYPLTETKAYALPMDSSNGGEQRMLATGTVTLPGGKTFRFGCTHLEAYHKTSRDLQIKEICRIADETSLPFIVAGDFNANEGSDVINTLDEHFMRTCSNCPPTFWEDGETGAIDFIASKPKNAITVLSHNVIQNKEASDHMPVVAELQLK